jgi:hypothetical protein
MLIIEKRKQRILCITITLPMKFCKCFLWWTLIHAYSKLSTLKGKCHR